MKQPLLTKLVWILCLLVCSQTMLAQKFGYVNSAVILAELPALRQANSELETLQQQFQRQGKEMVDIFQAEVNTLQKKVEDGLLPPAEQQAEAEKLERRRTEITKFEHDMVSNLQNKRNELLEPIYAQVNEAINAVSKEHGYEMVFDQQVLLFGEDYLDLTNLVKAKLGI